MKRLAGVLAAFALLVACGHGDPDAASPTSTSTTANGVSTTTSAALSTKPTATTTKRQASTTTLASPSTTVPPAENPTTTTTFPRGAFLTTATVSKKCAKPGDKQKLTVKTKPEVAVTYVSQYSDGDSYNENGGGVSDKEGNFEDEFIVDLKAPDGTVTITVTAGTRQTGPSFDQVKYTVNC